VALTSLLAKFMERVVINLITSSVVDKLDPLQFAYRARRGTEDATLTLTNLIAKHLQQPKAYVRILFIDFSSAFKTMQTHILLQRLLNLSVNGGIILWIKDFLSDRPQRVLMKGFFSNELVLNTGAPQGCVLSPLLFSIYTDEMKVQNAVVSLYKYADDMALAAFLMREQTLCEQIYFDHVLALHDWCTSSALYMNGGKTRELIMHDFKPSDAFQSVIVNGQPVEVVECFKYLGTQIDSKLNFNQNTNFIFKKAMQRLFLLRKLRSFGVSEAVLETVYKSLIQSLLSFNITVWFGNLSAKNKGTLNRVVNTASKIIGRPQSQLSDIYTVSVHRKAFSITSDSSHPLYCQFEKLPSGRRYRMPLARRNFQKVICA
jgi:hypothetical protein